MSAKRWYLIIAMLGLLNQLSVCAKKRIVVQVNPKPIYVELAGIEYSGIEKGKLPLAQELFPDAELVWSKTFKGRMTDCAIAAKSGHVVIGMVQENWEGFVYLFSLDGKILWAKKSTMDSDIKKKCNSIQVDISENGKTIGVAWFGHNAEADEIVLELDINTQVYDISGEKIFNRLGGSELRVGKYVKISPQGGYIECDWGMFSRVGEAIEIGKILKNGQISSFAFISDTEILAQVDNSVCFFSFPDGRLKWKRQTEMDGWWANASNNYILLGNPSKVTLFDKKGNLLWAKNLGADAFGFSEDESYIGTYGGGRRGAVNIINTKTGELENSVKFTEGDIEQFPPYFLCLNNIIAVSGITGAAVSNQGKREGFYTYFLKLDEDKKIVDQGWRKGLFIGTSNSSYIGVYESDATKRLAGGDNSTKFTINLLKRRIK